MSSDNIQRQIEFMIAQQARFNEQHAKFNERQAKFDQKMLELEQMQRQNTEDITKLVGVVMNLTLHVQENSRQIAELIEHGKQTDRRLDELAASGRETDARLNVLVTVVERYFSNGKRS